MKARVSKTQMQGLFMGEMADAVYRVMPVSSVCEG
jgi:hypothetical protein